MSSTDSCGESANLGKPSHIRILPSGCHTEICRRSNGYMAAETTQKQYCVVTSFRKTYNHMLTTVSMGDTTFMIDRVRSREPYSSPITTILPANHVSSWSKYYSPSRVTLTETWSVNQSSKIKQLSTSPSCRVPAVLAAETAGATTASSKRNVLLQTWHETTSTSRVHPMVTHV